MKTIAKRVAGAALAVGLLGGSGLVTAGPATAERHYYKKAEAPNQQVCTMLHAAHYVAVRQSGARITSRTRCLPDNPGGTRWVGWIFYAK